MSGTTAFDPDPLPESVLIGFTWSGPPGQESEIRFEAEALFDPHRKEMADQPEADADRQEGEGGDPIQEPPGSEAEPIGDRQDSGGGFPVPILIGILAIGATAGLVLVKRSRTS